MHDTPIKFSRQYAIILAKRGIDEYTTRANAHFEQQVSVLVHHGLPTWFPFIRRRFTWEQARIYAKQHPTPDYRYLMRKVEEYRGLLRVFVSMHVEYVVLCHADVRLLLKFHRNDDHGDYYC